MCPFELNKTCLKFAIRGAKVTNLPRQIISTTTFGLFTYYELPVVTRLSIGDGPTKILNPVAVFDCQKCQVSSFTCPAVQVVSKLH